VADDALTGALAGIVADARAQVADGRAPNVDALTARIEAAARQARARAGADERAIARAAKKAQEQLARVVAVHRARGVAAREPAAPPVVRSRRPGRPGGSALRTRPTISGNMEVRKARDGDAVLLRWDAAPVTGWEVRFSERPDARSDYVVRETLELPADATSVALPLGERPLRVHLLGRRRDGQLIRRAIVSGLTLETWNDRWQRRATAA
jgi:hypothetical protein